jgi:hypothetical protein
MIELNSMVFGLEPFLARCTQALRQALCAPHSVLNYRSPVPLTKFEMVPILSFLISPGSIKKEPKCEWVTPRPLTHTKRGLRFPPPYHISYTWGYYSAPFAALLFWRSPDRSPVVSLGIFSDKSMCPGSTQPFEMSTRIFLRVKTAGT